MPGHGWPEGDNFALPLCKIVSRFGVGVAQKLAVQAVPVEDVALVTKLLGCR